MTWTRRHMMLSAAALGLPVRARAATAREIMWEDLIPPGVPYGEIIGDGDMDLEADTWNPIFDENATKLNMDLDGVLIRMPGFIVPLDLDTVGVTDFILVPYLGACIHVPPPPPNQLVLVRSETPWPGDALWDAVWVTGMMQAALSETDIADTGYRLAATEMEIYEW